MACHLSIFAAFLLVSTTTFVSAKMAICTIGGSGTLTMFSGETAEVKFPCKYRMAHFTCSGYEVKVTPGSAFVGAGGYSPDTVWVKITELASEDYFVGRTSAKRITDHIDHGTSVWERTGGVLPFDKEDYFEGGKYARLVITGKVKVQFATSGNERGVMVKCTYDSDADFVSNGYPTSLCGIKSSTNVISARKAALFNAPSLVSDDSVILYDALDHTNVVQSSEECKDAAEDFQTCENSKNESIQTCGPIFTDATLAGCLINDNNEIGRFQDCVKLACNNNMATCATKRQSFKSYVELKCGTGTFASTFSALSCP